VSLQTKARVAAGGLRAATPVDVEAGLARLRRTHHRRTATRLAGAALVVAAVVGTGALALEGTDRAAPPVDQGPVENRDPSPGGIVHGVERGGWGTPSYEVLSLPNIDAASFPAWQAFDQDTGRFLLISEPGAIGSPTDPQPSTPAGYEAQAASVRTMRVLTPGLDAPVATIHCDHQCNFMHSFGPGRDEVTTPVFPGINGQRPRMAQVWGFDGELRDEIDLSGVLYGRGIADLEWSPDGSRLAVSTFWGAAEPDCPGERPTRAGVPNDGRVYLFDPAGGDPELVYRQRAQRPQERPPVLTDLAWSPDGDRLGLVSSTYCHHGQPESPRLLSLDVELGQAQTLYQFDDTYNDYFTATEGFAWSPDGTRIAVTSGTGIAEISSGGQPLTTNRGSGQGPLAWLAPSDD
jgi:hypothetical protein